MEKNALAQHADKLIHFVEIAKAGSLQGAARRLNITASSLTYSLEILEHSLETSLFRRTSRGLDLTEAGKRLLKLSEDILDQMYNLSHQLKHENAQPQIRIGTFSSLAIHFWPLLYKTIRSEIEVNLSIRTDRSLKLNELLYQGEIDLALAIGKTNNAQQFIQHTIYEDEFAFFCRSGTPKENISNKCLPIFLLPDAEDSSGKDLISHIHSFELSEWKLFYMDSIEAMSHFCLQGLGIALLPIKMAKPFGSKLEIVKIASNVPKRFAPHQCTLSYRKSLDLKNKLLEVILKCAKNAAISLEE